MINKRHYPLIIINKLSKYINYEGELFEVTEIEKGILLFEDLNHDSDFKFKIDTTTKKSAFFDLSLLIKPYGTKGTQSYSVNAKYDDLDKYFLGWINTIKSYNTNDWFNGNAIVNGFRKSYFDEFKFDKSTDTNLPLAPSEIFRIDSLLSKLNSDLTSYSTEKTKELIAEISIDISETQDALVSESKSKIANRISVIWAKITTIGLKAMKDLLSESKKQVMIESVRYGIELFTELIS